VTRSARATPHLARQLGKHRATIRVALKRLQARRQVATKMGPVGTQRGEKGLFYIIEQTTETSETTQYYTVTHSDCVDCVVSVVWDAGNV
jgi:DNA-binding FadR family transcriptional regulator